MNRLRDFEEFINLSSQIVLYGAGKICHKILQCLSEIGKLNLIVSIVVSDLKCKKKLYGIEVEEYKAEMFSENQLFFITSVLHEDEIRRKLLRDKRENIFSASDNFEKNLDLFQKNIMKPRIKQIHKNMITEYRKYTPVDNYDIAFISPPYWDMYSPFSAVPCLIAWLREKGYSTFQIDMGIICIHYAIQRFGKVVMAELLSESFYDLVIRKYKNNRYTSYSLYYEAMDFLQGDYFDVDRIKKEYLTFEFEKKCVVDEFYRKIYWADVTNIDFDTCSSIDVMVDETMLMTLYESFAHEKMKYFFRNIPEVVGISITSSCQFIPGCVIAKIIHHLKPETKIIFGGSCADLFVNSEYKNKADIYKYFDYVIVGEGETALLKLLENLKKKSRVHVPNLFCEDGEKLKELIIEDVQELQVPNYDDLDLSLYLAPELILPYQSSRGCHYGQCAFCNHDEKYRHNYRSKNMKKVVDDLVFLSKKYDVHCFQFVDEAIRPDCFQIMIDEMEKNEEFEGITWFFYSRVSRSYDVDLVRKAYKNGCRMVMFGIESFNQRLLRFIKKGINAETAKYCLQVFSDNNIKTYVWMLDNLPSETVEEALEDLEELKKVISYIDAFSISAFMLVKNCDMYKNLEDYNIIEINEADPCRFQSHNDGKIIDREAMLKFHIDKYCEFQRETFLTGSRYTLFFS